MFIACVDSNSGVAILGSWGVSDWALNLLDVLSASLFSSSAGATLGIFELFLKRSIVKSIWVSAPDDSLPFEEDSPFVCLVFICGRTSKNDLLSQLVGVLQREVARTSNQ